VGFLFAFGFAIRRTHPINWGAKYQRIGGLKPTLQYLLLRIIEFGVRFLTLGGAREGKSDPRVGTPG